MSVAVRATEAVFEHLNELEIPITALDRYTGVRQGCHCFATGAHKCGCAADLAMSDAEVEAAVTMRSVHWADVGRQSD